MIPLGEIEVGHTSRDLHSSYHVMTRDRSVEYRPAVQFSSAITLSDISRLKKTLLLPFRCILLFLLRTLTLFNRIILELKLTTHLNIASVLSSLELRHSCVRSMNTVVRVRCKNRQLL